MTEALFLDCQESSRVVRRSRGGLGPPRPLHLGRKILLSRLPEDQLERLLGPDLPKLTRRSKGSPKSIERELATVRSRGLAVSDEECEAGLRAVAVLVPGGPTRGVIDAALSVSALAERLDPARLRSIVATTQGLVEGFEGRTSLHSVTAICGVQAVMNADAVANPSQGVLSGKSEPYRLAASTP